MTPPTDDGDRLWAWQEREPNGKHGVIAAYIPAMDVVGPLMARAKWVADSMRPIAEAHALKTGRPVRLARFVLEATEEEGEA